jgi:precorrin-6B methylase 2
MMEDLLSAGSRQAILKATLDAVDLRMGDRFVDVGCGTGELAMMAARIVSGGLSHGAAGEAIGIDATPGMIEIARNAPGRRTLPCDSILASRKPCRSRTGRHRRLPAPSSSITCRPR